MALLRRPSPSTTPERTALAQAISAHNEHLSVQAAVVNAEGPAAAAVTAARDAVRKAEAALEEAPEAHTRYHIAKARGALQPAPQSAREAADALADAEAELVAAETALEALRAEAQSTTAYSPTERRLQEAVRAVLLAEGSLATSAVVAEVDRLQQELVRMGQMLRFLIDKQAFPVSTEIGSTYGKPADRAIRDTLNRLHWAPLSWSEICRQQDGAAGWRSALAALQIDAAAPLPSPAQIRSAA